MQVNTIAEWVEDEEIYNELMKMGGHYAQGYYVGKPAPIIAAASE